VIYTPDKIPAVVEAFGRAKRTLPSNCALALGIGCAPGSNIPTILISPFYNGSEAEGRKVFKEFFDIESAMEMMESRPYVKQVFPRTWQTNLRTISSSHITHLVCDAIRRQVPLPALHSQSLTPLLNILGNSSIMLEWKTGEVL
jgi:hypothetical protein